MCTKFHVSDPPICDLYGNLGCFRESPPLSRETSVSPDDMLVSQRLTASVTNAFGNGVVNLAALRPGASGLAAGG